MRNLIFGCIGVLWGGNILLGAFIKLLTGKFSAGPNAAYAAGQMAGVVFGALLFGAGLYYGVKGWRETYGSGSQAARR